MFSPHVQKRYLFEAMDVLTNLIVVTSCNIYMLSNHYTEHLKLTQCYILIISFFPLGILIYLFSIKIH